MKLSDVLGEQKNIAELLDEDQLLSISEIAKKGFDADMASRRGWDAAVVEYLKLAMQICEEKTFPWAGAANVKYPLIATASMQFSARAYPTLVPTSKNLVHVAVYGAYNPEKEARSKRVGDFMSYQILHDMPNWEDHMDNLLLILPIFGVAFKKVYFDASRNQNVAEMVHPFNIVVDYWTTELDTCSRISEVIYKNKREIIERQRQGLYLDVDLGAPTLPDNIKERINVTKDMSPTKEEDEFSPYMLVEQHTYIDLDDDGYSEPYVVLFEYSTGKVLRITARYSEEDIQFSDSGEISYIKPQNFYVKYSFIPSPDGSFYTRGFGHLLGPLNEAINTTLNQLIDGGTLSNLQSGFLGKGLKIRSGDVRFKPGEWKPVNNLGSDIKQNVFPLPVREPSNVLFQLLGMLIQSGKELASVAEIFVGKMPGQNTPAYTTQQTVEQGMKLFTAIYKRVYRSLDKEFKMLYNLNYKYLDDQEYQQVLDQSANSKQDFGYSDKDVCPTADPTAASDFEKQQRYQRIGQLLQLGTINPMVYSQKAMEVEGFTEAEIKELMNGSPATQPKQPSPEEKQAEMDMAAGQQKMQLEQAKVAMKAKESEFKLVMQQQEHAFNMKMEAQRQVMEQQFESLKAALELKRDQQKHQQQLIHNEQNQRQKARAAAATPTKKGTTK